MKRENSKKYISIALCLLLTGGMLSGASAAPEEDAVLPERTETVYIAADAEGEIKSIISSVYISNPDAREIISDPSSLTGIRNIASNEAPEKTADGWTFRADGEDVCYQGTAKTEELPVDFRITYVLDGIRCHPEEIKGKSGHLKVTVSLKNRYKKQVNINGEEVGLYTPFTVITMIPIPDGFKQLRVKNAKMMNDAGSTMVVGTTFPGLAENLETEAEDSLAESFSFEADVESFSMESVNAVIVPNLMSTDDLGSMKDLDDFINGVHDLNDAGEDLQSGGKKLYSGLKKFAEGINSFKGNMGGLVSAAQKIKDADIPGGIGKMKSAAEQGKKGVDGAIGALQDIRAGLPEEQQGQIDSIIRTLGQSSYAVGEVADGLGQILSPLEKLPELSKGIEQVQGGISGLYDGAVKLRKGSWALYKGLREFYDDGLQELEKQTKTLSVTSERKEAILDLGEEYMGYSVQEPESGSVRFMITTDSVYVPKAVPEGLFIDGEIHTSAEIPQTEPAGEQEKEKNFFEKVRDWVRNLFQKH